jgi:cation diffusion facilitator family transporter
MITEWLLKRFVGPGDPDRDPAHRARYGLLEGWMSVAANIALFLVKGALGLATGSIAVLADAVHSLSDTATSGVVIFGFRTAKKPSDEEHPFGHGRAETIATLVVAVLIIVVGVEFCRTSLGRLMQPSVHDITWPMVAILAGTVVIKEWLARFSRTLARRIDSDALEADSWHHRTDSISTGLVIVGLVLSRHGLSWVDGVVGLLVSAFVVWVGFEIGRRAVNGLLGEAPTEEEVEEIRRKAMQVDGVEGVHEIIVHRYGIRRAISMHIEVSAEQSALDLHTVADRVERSFTPDRDGTVVVHVDPIDRNHPHYEEVHRILDEVVAGDDRCHSFHDLRIVGASEEFQVLFDLAVRRELRPEEEHQIRERLTARLQQRFPLVRAVVCVEPAFVRSG